MLDLFVVNNSNDQEVWIQVVDASHETRPCMIEGAGNAKGPFRQKDQSQQQQQHVGRYAVAVEDVADVGDADDKLSVGGYAVYLFTQQHGVASFDRVTFPPSQQQAVVTVEGPGLAIRVARVDAKKPLSTPLWASWVYIGIVAACVLGGVAFIIFKCVT